jgi:hypothetical protein
MVKVPPGTSSIPAGARPSGEASAVGVALGVAVGVAVADVDAVVDGDGDGDAIACDAVALTDGAAARSVRPHENVASATAARARRDMSSAKDTPPGAAPISTKGPA